MAGQPDTTVYTLTVTGTNACVSTDSVELIVNPRPAAPVISPSSTTVCPDATGIVYDLVSSLPNTTYNWTISGGTVASGQGTNSITVDWGTSNPAASVTVTATNDLGCEGLAAIRAVDINQILNPDMPVGDENMCSDTASNIVYTTSLTTGSSYNFGTDDGTANLTETGNQVTIDWTTTGLKKLWVVETDTTNTSFCIGTSDTLIVEVNPAPNPGLVINGPDDVCETGTGTAYNLNGFANSTYSWDITTPGTVASGQTTSSILANFDTAGTSIITVRETTDKGCNGVLISKTVEVQPLPTPTLVSNDMNICPQDLTGKVYTATGNATGSVFLFDVVGGTGVTSANQITIDWAANAPVYQLIVSETSSFGCVSVINDTIDFIYDNTSLAMNYVTITAANEDDVLIDFQALNAANLPTGSVLVQERITGNWITLSNEPVSTLPLPQSYTSVDQPVNSQIHYYRIQTDNACGFELTSPVHGTVLLNAIANEANQTVQLNWNDYLGWNTDTLEIYRNLENGAFTLLQTITSGDTSVQLATGADGFNQCYYVKAKEASGIESSLSNTVCVNFTNTLQISNVLTPNGDGFNDNWLMSNASLYNVKVKVMNRWGKEVYESNSYNNDWNGDGLPFGVYFYTVEANAQGVTYQKKGMVTILK